MSESKCNKARGPDTRTDGNDGEEDLSKAGCHSWARWPEVPQLRRKLQIVIRILGLSSIL